MTPPSPAITVRIVGATDVGLIREHNEDNYTVLNLESGEVDFSQGRELPLPSTGALLVVCDGMGGAAAGEVASHMAVEVIRRELGPKRAPEASAGSPGRSTSDSTGGSDKSTGSKDSDAAKTGDGLNAVSASPDTTAATAEAETAEKAADGEGAADSKTAPASATPPQAAEKTAGSSADRASDPTAQASTDKADPPRAAAMAIAGSPSQPEVSGPLSEAQLHSLARKLRQAGQRANQEIYEAACADISKAGMGTTLTCLMLLRSHVIVGQVGDSRAYLCRKGRLTQITHDQSLVNQLLESGQITPEQAKLFEHSNVILQALGVQEDVEVVLSTETVRRGDRLMLCSDGLVGVVSDEEIEDVLAHCEQVEEAVRRLIELARAGGGPDNITVIVAEVDGDAAPAPAEQDLAEYRVLYLDGEKPPERRMWGAEYAYMAQPSGARDVMGTAAAAPATSSRLSIISMAAVFALLLVGILGGVLYQPRRPAGPGPVPAVPTGTPLPALPPTLGATPSSPNTGSGLAGSGSTIAPTSVADGSVAATPAAAIVAGVDAGSAVPVATGAAHDGGTADAAAAIAHESEDDPRPSELADPEESSKHGKRKKRRKKTADEPADEPGAGAQTTTPAQGSPSSTGDASEKPAPEKPTAEKPVADEKPPTAEKPAAEKPAAEKPAAEKPAAEKPTPEKPTAEKPAAEKPATEKPALEKPVTDKPAVPPAASPSPAN